MIKRKQIILLSVLMIFAIPFFFASCKDKVEGGVNLTYDPETVPTMRTDSVTELISDSGLIRYKVITKTWEVFDEAKEPHWFFPEKVYLEQFDTTFNVILTVKADTAWNYVRKKLWRLKGNVFFRNELDETFESDEFFWDQQKEKIYSDKLVKIDRPQKMTFFAIGFVSNQQMTEFVFRKFHDAEVYYNEEQEKGDITQSNDTLIQEKTQ